MITLLYRYFIMLSEIWILTKCTILLKHWTNGMQKTTETKAKQFCVENKLEIICFRIVAIKDMSYQSYQDNRKGYPAKIVVKTKDGITQTYQR